MPCTTFKAPPTLRTQDPPFPEMFEAIISAPLVGACLVTGDRISATRSDTVSQCVLRSCACFWPDHFRAYNHALKGPQKPKTYRDSELFAILSSTPSSLLGREPCGDGILRSVSKRLPHDSTFQLRLRRLFARAAISLAATSRSHKEPGLSQRVPRRESKTASTSARSELFQDKTSGCHLH